MVLKFPAKFEQRLSRLVLGAMMLGATFVAEKALERLAKTERVSPGQSAPTGTPDDESHGAEIRHLHP